MSDPYGYPREYVDPSVNPSLWLGLAIASSVLCCAPLGIVGIVYAAMAMDARSRGDDVLCAQRVASARAWTLWSIVISLVVVVLAICLSVAQR
jgi:hypothetical protein